MKILVYGAGVLGSLYAARLQAAGEDVSILARGRRLAEIREQGIVLENSRNGARSAAPMRAVERLDAEDAYDWVLILVRRNQLASVVPDLAANGNTPNLLFMVNNASDPNELANLVGQERVLLGFPGAGGTRQGGLVRYSVLPGLIQPTTVGELDGRISPRLREIAGILRRAGFPVAVSRRMEAWLKTHAAWVSQVANALYMVGGSNYHLARTRDAVVLMVRAIREGFRMLTALGYPVEPARLRAFEWLPESLLVFAWRRVLATEWAETVMARHACAARDEMKQLADDLQVLARAAPVATPAIDRLYTYIDSDVTPIAESSAQTPLRH